MEAKETVGAKTGSKQKLAGNEDFSQKLGGKFWRVAFTLLTATRTRKAMPKENPDDLFETALRSLREREDEFDLTQFEQGVWSEIALRDESLLRRCWVWIKEGGSGVPLPAAFACGVVAIVSGVVLALSQSNAYGKQASLAMEQRYVESIHPVLMSAKPTQ